jgi:hypothetical protein
MQFFAISFDEIPEVIKQIQSQQLTSCQRLQEDLGGRENPKKSGIRYRYQTTKQWRSGVLQQLLGNSAPVSTW